MKNLVKFGTIFAIFLLALPIFAKDDKLKNPGKNEVILVGRVVVKTEENMEFYAKTRGIAETEKPSTYAIPFAPEDPNDYDDDYEDFVDDNQKQVFNDGEFFYAVYKVNKKTRNMKFDGMSRYKFFGTNKAFIYIPFDFNLDVPEGIPAVYLGSFYFTTTGSNFTFKSIDHIDEYELAQEALDKVTKKHFDLYRADLKENPKEEGKKKK